MGKRNELVERVYKDYYDHLNNMQDNDYSSIYMLVEMLEDEWNGQGADLEYEIDIKENYLYLENTKICSMDELQYCEAKADSIVYHFRGVDDKRLLYIVIGWVAGEKASISQIYIEENDDEENCKILFER